MKRAGQASACAPSPRRLCTAHWSMKLIESMENPEMVVQSDELTVTIKDAYPKAKHHFLVLPKEDIPSLRHLNRTHIPLLKQMLENGITLTKTLIEKDATLEFRHGYHASPSMNRLHMHVISQDFVSPCLKNKKHWNSFTTEFFVDAEQVIEILKAQGEVKFDKSNLEEFLKLPLKCHKCEAVLSNIPKLKVHLDQHARSKLRCSTNTT